MVTVVQGKVCAKDHPDRLSRLATIHQRYRQTDGRISYGIGLDLTVGQKVMPCVLLIVIVKVAVFIKINHTITTNNVTWY